MKLKPFFAEFIATFLFVFIGVLSVAAAFPAGSTLGQIGPALAHGLAIAILASAIAHISGGQLNPAVTIAVWLANKVSLGQAILNIVGQIAGALLAIRGLAWALGHLRLDDIAFGIPGVGDGIGNYQAMFLEGVLTFVLVLVVFGTMVDARAPKMGALFVGLSVAAAGLSVGPLTGACLNPARYLGPAIVANDFSQVMVYTAGPILGAAVAALVYTYGIGKADAAGAEA